ncbi:PA2169 family four-helix-bundle protein [Flavobacterium sp.]|uniref:ferritin-like domain-containing protein n=1 Tax=Flavobacterium sp. TaxID=239 RepID=UPI003750768D
MKNIKTIEVLNTLTNINKDRIEVYKTASNETEEQDLKTLFVQFSSTSQKCKQELKTEVTKLGGPRAEHTTISGNFFRMWMDVKAELTGKDRYSILNSCEYVEEMTKDTYEEALENDLEYLNVEQQTMIKKQQTLLVTDFHKVKSMGDALLNLKLNL